MLLLLNAAWTLSAVLKYCGVAVGVLGVGIFGYYFVRENARSAHIPGNSVPASAWRGRGPKLGIMVLAAGVLMQVVSFIIIVVLPGRT